MPPRLLLPLLFGLLLVSGCARALPELALSGPAMGTTYTVKVIGAPADVDASTVRVAIDDVLAHIDRTLSGYRTDSEVSRFNASASTQWLDVSADLANVVLAALEVSGASSGAFDVTVAPLVALWGFGPGGEPAALPESEALARTRTRVGYRHLHARADPPALRKDIPELQVDLNGIAPGFAVDRLAARFESMHIENFMIDLGGEVRSRGVNAQGKSWRIAIERPEDGEPVPYAIVSLDDEAVTTSGEYRHYYVRNGRRYSHTIDPRTGRPIEHELASVVVIGPTSMHTDAWATAFNVLGSQAGYTLARERHMPVMFIERRDGQLQARVTAEWDKKRIADGG